MPPANPTEPRRRRNAFLDRGGMWVIAQGLLMLGVIFAGVWRHPSVSNPVNVVFGMFLIIVGAVFGIAGWKELGGNRTAFPKPSPTAPLVRHGIYARVRHPLYTSVISLSFGWALCWRSGPAFYSAVALTLLLLAKARQEEHWLRQQFPEYAEYQRRVPRFIPKL